MIDQIHGWPIVTATNCYDIIRGLGIRPWKSKGDAIHTNEYLISASDGRVKEYSAFCPQTEVEEFEKPNGSLFNGFRALFKPACCVIALVDDYVLVTVEFKHGNKKITIVPVSGVPGKAAMQASTLPEKMGITAYEEWKEETGTTLDRLELLSSEFGVPMLVRNAEARYFPYLGYVTRPIRRGPTKLDANEELCIVAFHHSEWLTLIINGCTDPGFNIESCAITTTLLAYNRLGLIKLSVGAR